MCAIGLKWSNMDSHEVLKWRFAIIQIAFYDITTINVPMYLELFPTTMHCCLKTSVIIHDNGCDRPDQYWFRCAMGTRYNLEVLWISDGVTFSGRGILFVENIVYIRPITYIIEGVTVTQLWWHLANMNMVFKRQNTFIWISWTHGPCVQPIHINAFCL